MHLSQRLSLHPSLLVSVSDGQSTRLNLSLHLGLQMPLSLSVRLVLVLVLRLVVGALTLRPPVCR